MDSFSCKQSLQTVAPIVHDFYALATDGQCTQKSTAGWSLRINNKIFGLTFHSYRLTSYTKRGCQYNYATPFMYAMDLLKFRSHNALKVTCRIYTVRSWIVVTEHLNTAPGGSTSCTHSKPSELKRERTEPGMWIYKQIFQTIRSDERRERGMGDVWDEYNELRIHSARVYGEVLKKHAPCYF